MISNEVESSRPICPSCKGVSWVNIERPSKTNGYCSRCNYEGPADSFKMTRSKKIFKVSWSNGGIDVFHTLIYGAHDIIEAEGCFREGRSIRNGGVSHKDVEILKIIEQTKKD